jgi:hypothetical protein
MDDGLEDLVDPFAGLCAARNRSVGIDADHILDLDASAGRIGLGQVHLVEDREHLDAEVERGIAIGDRLRLDPWLASTTRSAPSQADSERLTSYEKSTWPGVSMRFRL